MKKIELSNLREVEMVISALYGIPAKGVESLRLVDKVLTALERIINIRYDDDGNVIAYETENGRVKIVDGKPVRALSFRDEGKRTLELEDAHAEFLKSRLGAVEWQGSAARAVLNFMEKFEKNGTDN